jgi:phage nucleotide-binding protein
MAIKLTSTRQAAQTGGLKITVYGAAGAGKTSLCATTGGKPVILSAEAGLLSLRHHDIPVIEVSTIADVTEAYQYLQSSAEGKQFDWVCLDSISEIAEVVLAAEKKQTRDPRQAYGALQEKMYELIRAFRDLPERNVYFSAKMLTEKVDIVETRTTGTLTTNQVVGTRLTHGPSLPGTKLGQALPYFTDLILAMRVEPDADGTPSRWLQTQPDDSFVAKDRSGALDPFEKPDLAAIAAKVRNPNAN